MPQLTDLNHSDAGISILRLLARESDQLAFYIDEAFREGYVELARFMQSLIDIAKTVDILPKITSSAQNTLTLTRKPNFSDQLLIPRFSSFTRPDGVTYLVDQDVTLPVDEESIDAEVTQGTLVTLSLEPGDFEISEITGRAQYNLGANVAAGTVAIWHGETPTYWTEIDSFWRSLSTDYHFRLELFAEPVNNEFNTVYLVLGDGVEGKQLPPSTLSVQFLRTAAENGNAGYGMITGVPSDLIEKITATNGDPATGGGPVESISDFRRRIPRVVQTQRRGLTTTDYEALIESIAGVKHCQALDRNYGSQYPHLYMKLFIVSEGGGPMSDQLEILITAKCCDWGHLGAWTGRYIISDAVEVPVNITCRIGIVAGYSSQAVISAVQAALTSLLSTNSQIIAGTLSYSDIHSTALSVAGVSWADIDLPLADVSAGNGEILTAGTMTVTAA